MKITSKGQVTVPVELRIKAGLMPGDEVEFELEGKVIKMRKSKSSPRRGQKLVAHMRGRGGVSMSTDQIMALTRGTGRRRNAGHPG